MHTAYNEWLNKLSRYCAFQERNSSEVEERMEKLGVDSDMRESLMEDLRKQKFVDDERYIKSFVRGKFRMKSWGRNKIRAELKQKGMKAAWIEAALKSEIDAGEYESTAKKQLAKKMKTLLSGTPLSKKQKAMRFLLSKGFEMELIRRIV